MSSSPNELAPTLWRTCRALANRRRLLMVHDLIRHADRTVSEVAENVGVPMAVASEYLRALNARGVLRATRSGRQVSYCLAGDPSVAHSVPLVKALKSALQSNPVATGLRVAFADLTAFTHARRIRLVQALAEGPASLPTLAQKSGIPARSARRHLSKLVRRGYAVLQGGRFTRACPDRPLATTLLSLALEGK